MQVGIFIHNFLIYLKQANLIYIFWRNIMELWDVLDKHGNKTGKVIER